MKKLIVLLILFMASVSFAATATWEVASNADVIDGFTLRWHDNSNPSVIWNMTAPSGAARSMNLLDGWFMPGHEYTFEIEAYNGSGKSNPSDPATFMVSQPAYVAPGDLLPTENSILVPPSIPGGLILDSLIYKFDPK